MSQVRILSLALRVSYSGNTSAFQADAVSSILSTRSKEKA
jgi:hypothetical protein